MILLHFIRKGLVMRSRLGSDFFTCGTAGWCMEIVFTSLHCVADKNPKLIGNTSIWMFPIYGLACLLHPVCTHIKDKSVWLRGSIYTIFIFVGEYITGSFLRRFKACPWDYSESPLNIKGLIRLDYAPLWFVAGLLFEKILCRH